MKVFLSHSSADADLARRLALDLESANVDVWLDQWELGVGEEIEQSIEQGVDESEFVIVLLTRASVASEWVDREWRRKVHDEAQSERLAVVPVRGEPCEIPDFLAQRSHADVSGGSYPLGFKRLLEILRHYSGEAGIEIPESTFVEEESSLDLLPIVTPIGLEVSRDLIPLFEQDSEGTHRFLDELASGVRDTLRAELGFPFPGIRVRGNETDMPPRSALIMIDEVPEIMLEVGRDAAEHLAFALQAVIRRMASLFLDVDVARRLVDTVARTAPELVAEVVPKAVSWFELTDVLRRLVDEEIGIGDMEHILKALSQCEGDLRDTVLLAERARHALSGQITAKFIRGRDSLPVLLLDPEIEALISSAFQRTSVGAYLALDPQLTQDILAAVRGQVSSLGPGAAGVPILLTAVEVRPYLRKLVMLEFPSLHVLSRQDLEPDTQIQTVARIRLDRTSHPATPTGRGPAA